MPTRTTTVVSGLTGAALVAAIGTYLMTGQPAEVEREEGLLPQVEVEEFYPQHYLQNYPLHFAESFEERYAAAFPEEAEANYVPVITSAFGEERGVEYPPGYVSGVTPPLEGLYDEGPPPAEPIVSLTVQKVTKRDSLLREARTRFRRALMGGRLLAELRNDAPDDVAIDASLKKLGIHRGTGAMVWRFRFFAKSITNMAIVDCTYEPDMAKWALLLAEERPAQVILGWDRLNNIDQQETATYPAYGRDVRAIVRMIKAVSPNTFVWVTVCAYQPTYPAWMEHVGKHGDGIALYGIAFFPAVPYFQQHYEKHHADSGGKPILLTGFYGVKPGAQVPAGYDFDGRMKDAVKRAEMAGFAGLCWVERK